MSTSLIFKALRITYPVIILSAALASFVHSEAPSLTQNKNSRLVQDSPVSLEAMHYFPENFESSKSSPFL